MEIRKPRLGLGKFLNLRMTQIPLGCEDSNTFKYITKKDAYHNHLQCTPIIDVIRNICCK